MTTLCTFCHVWLNRKFGPSVAVQAFLQQGIAVTSKLVYALLFRWFH